MLISLNWINDFTKLPITDADDLANEFTMTTAEVEEIKKSNEHLAMIKVAQIDSIRPHPEADKLNLVTINFGSSTKEVVCGASNVRVGLKIPYAPIGVTIPSGLTLEPKKIRGILSEGMLCSETELGLSDEAGGLMELPEDAPIGTPMGEYLNIASDTLLDVDNKSLTHRPDLWGHYGLAREFAAAYETELLNPFNDEWKTKMESYFTKDDSPIKPIVNESSCKAYWGLSLDNVKVGATPKYIKDRIEAVGLRSINNIVDISNYVMLELGMPLHIFDRSKIAQEKVEIKRLESETEFITLDDETRKLIPGDTVICDGEKPLVLAGIMGGLNSGVDETTTSIFIEVANWNPEQTRSTSTRLGLRTDSSQRYEKTLDSQLCYRTLLRTLEIVLELCPEAKVVGKPEYAGDDLNNFIPLSIKTSTQRIRKILGHEVEDEKIVSIFERLDFKVENNNGDLNVTIPSYRTTKDIEIEADLIEEIGRVIGYDNIIPVSPQSNINPVQLSPAKDLTRKIQDFMCMNAKSLEVMTYPLVGETILKKSKWDNLNEELVLVNALSKDADRMRPSLIPQSLNTVAINAKNFDSFSFFEVGRVYLSDEKNFSKERHHLLIGSFSKNENPFLNLINTTERLLNFLNIPYDKSLETGKFPSTVLDSTWEGNHPHEHLHLRIMGKFTGVINSVHPLLLKAMKIKGNYSFALIDIEDFMQRTPKAKASYKPISKYPSSLFDCTVLVSKDMPSAAVLDCLKKTKAKEITSSLIVDVFDLDEDNNAVTIRSTFEDANSTLDATRVKSLEDLVVETLGKNGFNLKS